MIMEKKKSIVFVLLMVVIASQLCGFTFFNASVAIDTEKNHVYKYLTVDSVNADFAKDEKQASSKYNNNYYLLSGTISSMTEKGDSFTLKGINPTEEVECSCKKNIRSSVLGYADYKDTVAVYGEMKVDLIDKERHLEVEKVVKAPTAIKSADTYFSFNGDTFDVSTGTKRTLANGRVEYFIPSKWKGIEHSIIDENLGIMEGYQYVLNKTSGEKQAEPESLFICYFDKKLLKESDDIKELKDVEKLIISNIEGDVGRFPAKEQTSYYGVNYKYYLGSYKDALDAGKGYRTEYVFQEDKGNGIVMFLYVYREPNYLSDVMFVTRFLTISSNRV